jgi:hypothetical protein
MSQDQWRQAIISVMSADGVTTVRIDSVRIPYIIAKVSDLKTLSKIRRFPMVDYVEPARMRFIPMELGDCDVSGGLTSGGQSPYNGTSLIVAPFGSSLPDLVSNNYPDMGIFSAWKMTNGAGMTVGITDTGLDIEGASEFSTANFTSGESGGRTLTYIPILGSPIPQCSHGTRIAGLVAAPKNGRSTVGVAYGANVVAVYQANGENPQIDKAADAIANAVANGARVVVMAWGEFNFYDLVANLIAYFYYNGDVMFVGAAGTCPIGNSCPRMGSAVFPAELEEVLAVSGADADGTRPENMYDWGSKSGVLAYTNLASTGMRTTAIVNVSGSSGATGLVGGVATLVRAKTPSLTNRQVMDRIIQTSGSLCGGPHAWRDDMVNASAAVGGPCVWRLVGPLGPFFIANYYINDQSLGMNSVTGAAQFVTRHWANNAFAGGSGSYQFDWTFGDEVIIRAPRLDGDYTDTFGNLLVRSYQQFSFLPAADGNPYVSVITVHVRDLVLGTDDVRRLTFHVCQTASNCAATQRGYPGGPTARPQWNVGSAWSDPAPANSTSGAEEFQFTNSGNTAGTFQFSYQCSGAISNCHIAWDHVDAAAGASQYTYMTFSTGAPGTTGTIRMIVTGPFGQADTATATIVNSGSTFNDSSMLSYNPKASLGKRLTIISQKWVHSTGRPILGRGTTTRTIRVADAGLEPTAIAAHGVQHTIPRVAKVATS